MTPRLQPVSYNKQSIVGRTKTSDVKAYLGRPDWITLDKLFKYLHRLGVNLEMKTARMRKTQ